MSLKRHDLRSGRERATARIRRELHADVEMLGGGYGVFKVVVDGDTVVDGGAAAFVSAVRFAVDGNEIENA